MIRTRAKKVLRELWERKGRTALASLAIFIGVLGVVVLVSMGDLLTQQFLEDVQEGAIAMQQVALTLPGQPTVDNAAYIANLETLPGVANVEGRVSAPLLWKKPSDAKFKDGSVEAAWEPFDQINIQPMRLVDGRFPVAGQNELAIDRRMGEAQGVEIGDGLVVAMFGPDGLTEETWTVVGTVFQPYLVGIPGSNPAEVAMFATYEDSQHLLGSGASGLTALLARYVDFAAAEQQAENLAAAVNEGTPYLSVYTFTTDPQAYLRDQQRTIQILSALAIMALVVSGFLVLNIINTVVVEQRQQIGVMKSLGATRSDNLLMYLGIALSYGVVGTVPAVLLGTFIGAGAAVAIGPMFGSYIENPGISMSGLVTGLIMGLLIPILAALIPVISGTRVTILEAMTDLGISVDYGRGLIARLIRVLPLPITVKQALSNTTRKKGRLFLTWLTLTLAAGAFMGVLGSFLALDQLIDGIFSTYNYQIGVGFDQVRDFDEMRAFITNNVDGIAAVYPGVGGVPIELENYVGPQGETAPGIIGFDTRSDAVRMDLEAGTGWEDNPDREGVVLSSLLAKRLEKEVGDRFVFTAGGEPYEREIIGLAAFPADAVFMDWRDVAQIGEQVFGEPTPTYVLVQVTAESPSGSEVDAIIEQTKETLVAAGINAGFFNTVALAEGISTIMVAFGGIFIAAALVTAAVGAIGLLATLSMAVFERQREIGVMRSVGAGSAAVAGQFLIEGNLIGLLAWLVAIPLAILLSGMLVMMFPFEMEAGVPVTALLVGLVGMFVIATISSLWPSINAARKTVSEILRYQ
jgi:putative ABC transport system permease protein